MWLTHEMIDDHVDRGMSLFTGQPHGNMLNRNGIYSSCSEQFFDAWRWRTDCTAQVETSSACEPLLYIYSENVFACMHILKKIKGPTVKRRSMEGKGPTKERIHACMTRLEIRDIRNRKAEPRREGTEIIADIT